jgi:putative transposase
VSPVLDTLSGSCKQAVARSGRVSVAGLACYKPGARSRLFYRTRVHRGRKGERRSMSEADYAGLVPAAPNQLHSP